MTLNRPLFPLLYRHKTRLNRIREVSTVQKQVKQPDGAATTPISRHAATFIFITVLIDAIGIGIIMPVMPDLLRELTDLPISAAAFWGGYLSFVFALMQFGFGPTVGNISDVFGRRPVLLASLGVLAIDYIIMGFAPSLWVLFIGRAIAGIAGATRSTANAFMTDISARGDRAKSFGMLGAAFGLGFVIGPVIGGIAGEYGSRVPFFVAAGIAALNFFYGLFVLPESLAPENRRSFDWARANPLGVARQLKKLPGITSLFLAIFIFNIAHFVYPAVWAYFTKQSFGWGTAEVGLSLSAVGVGFAIVQGVLMGPVLKKLGEKNTVLLGFAVSIVGLLAIAFATQGWMLYAAMPLTVFGAIITPALTGVISHLIPDNAQGRVARRAHQPYGHHTDYQPTSYDPALWLFLGIKCPHLFPRCTIFVLKHPYGRRHGGFCLWLPGAGLTLLSVNSA